MNSSKRGLFLLLVFLASWKAFSQTVDIEGNLAKAPVQEKPYLHLDNNSYFIGDTIWYKAYVVGADSLRLTGQSRVLYVELVSPDGLVVKRHRKFISANGWGDGDFVLSDTLYSGYYELRAYTRWMMNFDVTEHYSSFEDRLMFYNRQMAHDFFREYGTVWSRVFPVYEKPSVDGGYDDRQVIPRPRQRAIKPESRHLQVTFYPEGGHLVDGTRCRVAFEAVNEEGEAVSIGGRIGADTIHTSHMGRGVFWLDVSKSNRPKAVFCYQGKRYRYSLPDVEDEGIALTVLGDHAMVSQRSPSPVMVRAAFLTGGVLRSSVPVCFDTKGNALLRFDMDKLPTGVCDLVLYDTAAHVLADRLFFVNHHDYDRRRVAITTGKGSYDPYEKVNLALQAPPDVRLLSVAVRDADGDGRSYDTGNILTDLLLTSDIKGFVPTPDYYFEADDSVHRSHLDQLLMVQGWRRYSFRKLATASERLRYVPERNLEVDGAVYKYRLVPEVVPKTVEMMQGGIVPGSGGNNRTDGMADRNAPANFQEFITGVGQDDGIDPNLSSESQTDMNDDEDARPDREHGTGRGGLKHEVTVEAELYSWDGGKFVSTPFSLTTENGGHFSFFQTPYYGESRLWLSAHKTKMNTEEWERKRTKDFYKEDAHPDYYIKLNLFYPVFTRPYSFYENHQPPLLQAVGDEGSLTYKEGENGLLLQEVKVKGRRRRNKRAIDWTKPICKYDTMDLYNLATDYGLSFGKVDFMSFPYAVCMLLFGSYGENSRLNVLGLMDGKLLYRSYKKDNEIVTPVFGIIIPDVDNRSDYMKMKDLRLSRQRYVKFYTDFDLRHESRWLDQSVYNADVTVDFETIPDDGRRHVIRDRSVILQGFTEPDDFYHPDYSHRKLPKHKDYRRTLYWNPNLLLGSDGKATISFYNNGKDTRLAVSVAGVGAEGPACGQ